MLAPVSESKRAMAMLCASASLTLAPSAHAVEYDVNAESVAQAYQVRGPWGGPVLSARRFTQTVTVAITHAIGERGPRLALRLRLRLDGDFGDACGGGAARCLEEAVRERRTDFVPGFERRSVDLPYAYFDASGLLRGALDLRVGRILSSDVLGFFAFDGARVRAYLGSIATVEAYGGLEVRSGFLLSNARFERDGIFRVDRSNWEPSLAPYVSDRAYAPVVALALETPAWLPAFARAVYRRVWTVQGVSEERIGAALDAQLQPNVRLVARASFSFPHSAFTVLGASLAWDVTPTVLAEASFERIRPTFDPSSIWASIWADAVDDARLRCNVRWHGSLWSASAALYGRRYAQSEAGPSTNAAVALDRYHVGGSLSFLRDAAAWDMAIRAMGEGGAVGARGGLDVDVSFEPWGGHVRFDARGSLWGNYDSVRPDRSGPALALVGGASVALGALARLHVDGEWDHNGVAGHRFRLGATMVVGASP